MSEADDGDHPPDVRAAHLPAVLRVHRADGHGAGHAELAGGHHPPGKPVAALRPKRRQLRPLRRHPGRQQPRHRKDIPTLQ